MFRFPFTARLISRFCWELFLFGSEELKRLKVKKNLSNGNHQFRLFEGRSNVHLRQLWNANAANAVESCEFGPSLAS